MKWTRRSLVGVALAVSLTASFGPSQPANAQSIAHAEAQQIAADAYVYGYSLITTHVTRVHGSGLSCSFQICALLIGSCGDEPNDVSGPFFECVFAFG